MMQQQASNKPKFILPGQRVDLPDTKTNINTFYDDNGLPRSLYFGMLTVQDVGGNNYVDVSKKVTTYMPEKNNFVVGIIKAKVGDNYLVDINAPIDGVLGNLEFDGASKRNKPNLNTGDLVFARIAEYSKFIGAKLSCINTGYSAKGVLNELKGGMIVYGLRGKEKLIEEKIAIIKEYCKFQVAFGKNDILWFSCSESKTEMILYNMFLELLKGCDEQLFQAIVKMLKR